MTKIGKENRAGLANKDAKYTPGPGTHSVNQYSLSHSYGFGKGTRNEGGKSKDQTPGPGYYKLPDTVGQLASYQKPASIY